MWLSEYFSQELCSHCYAADWIQCSLPLDEMFRLISIPCLSTINLIYFSLLQGSVCATLPRNMCVYLHFTRQGRESCLGIEEM